MLLHFLKSVLRQLTRLISRFEFSQLVEFQFKTFEHLPKLVNFNYFVVEKLDLLLQELDGLFFVAEDHLLTLQILAITLAHELAKQELLVFLLQELFLAVDLRLHIALLSCFGMLLGCSWGSINYGHSLKLALFNGLLSGQVGILPLFLASFAALGSSCDRTSGRGFLVAPSGIVACLRLLGALYFLARLLIDCLA